MGGFEPVAKPWGMDGFPKDFAFSLLPEDWEHFRVFMEQAIVRIPALETAPVDRKSVVKGKSVDLGGRRIIKKKKGISQGCQRAHAFPLPQMPVAVTWPGFQ